MANLVRYNQPLASIFDDPEKGINSFLSSYPVVGNISFGPTIGDNLLPNVDVKEEDKFYIVKADIPGMEKKDIKISVDAYNNLLIEGERDSEVKKEEKEYLCFERDKGSFFRKIALRCAFDADGIKARYQNGVLEINIPKSKESIVKQISIED